MPSRRPTRRISFTKAALGRLTPPEAGRLYVYDKRTPGFALCLTDKGAMSFYVYCRVHGRPQRVRLGTYPAMTIEQARREATKVNGEIASGDDPQAKRVAARRAIKSVHTFQQVFDHYIKHHIERYKSAKTAAGDKYLFASIGSWKARRIDSIDTEAVKKLHTRIGRERGGSHGQPRCAVAPPPLQLRRR